MPVALTPESDRRVGDHADGESRRAVRRREGRAGGGERGADAEERGAAHHPGRVRRRLPRSEANPSRARDSCTAKCSATSALGTDAGSASSTTITRLSVLSIERRDRADRHLGQTEARDVACAEPDRPADGGHGRTPAAAAIIPST